jgi:hypothetical protein
MAARRQRVGTAIGIAAATDVRVIGLAATGEVDAATVAAAAVRAVRVVDRADLVDRVNWSTRPSS